MMPRTTVQGLLCATVTVVHPPSASTLELQNGSVKVTLVKEQGSFVEHWYAHDGKQWRFVMQSGSERRAAEGVGKREGLVALPFTDASEVTIEGDPVLELRASAGGDRVIKTIRLDKHSAFAAVRVTLQLAATREMSSFLSTYSFAPDGRSYSEYAPIDFVYTPQLRPDADQVIADHTFRSPALIMQEGPLAMAMVPELTTIDGRDRPLQAGADLQVRSTKRPFMSFGFMNWRRTKEHVYYVHYDSMLSHVGPGALTYGYHLYVNARAPLRESYRDIVRFLWTEYGSHNFLKPVNPQAEPFAAYIHKAWYEFVPSVALDTVYNGVPVTLLRQGRLAWSNGLPKAADDDSWFNVWFNALRTAYGMHLFGVASGDSALARQSVRVLNLALQAPRHGGLAPTIFYVDSAGGHWVADQGWGGIDKGKNLPMVHNAWTALWLLAWLDRLPERRAEIMEYTKGIADFLVAHQLPSGVIPSWYDPVTFEPNVIFRNENAETAGAASFLADFAARTGQRAYRNAAEKAMAYIQSSIVPEQRWFDYETFFSCARKPLGFFDTFTHQHPQNTLSIQMAADAYARLFELTGKKKYLEQGNAIVDYLCLFQQIWSPEWLSCQLFGGFGVQNTDAEWSDSRQGYFAMTFMKYYELTGEREYFERGVASLRAMFSLFESPTSPRTAENYGHSGSDKLAGVTGLHWGTGSSVVSIHLITQRYGDAFVDVRGHWGAGIDGCRIPAVRVVKDSIDVQLVDNVGVPRSVLLKFARMGKKPYTLIVNGETLGRFVPGELEKGIDVKI